MEYKILANEDAIKKILSKGVKNMPQNPAACGYKPDQIRKFYYETEELTLELIKAIEENIYKIIVNYAAIVEVDTLPEASNETFGKVYVLKGEIISKEKDLYKYAYTTIMQEDKYVWVKVSDNVLATLLSNGEGKYSIVTQEDDNRKNEAHGRSGISAGRLSKTYQRATFSFGGNNQSGMSEEEFKAYFWDANHLNEDGSLGAPINGGRGLDTDGNVLDRDGRKYEESYGFEFTTGQENKNYGKSALVGGEYNINYGLAALLVGKGLCNTGDFSVLLGGREISKDVPWRIINKGQGNLFFGYFLSSYNTTYEKDFNNCVLLGSGLVPSNDDCVGVGANGGDKHNSEGILRFFVGAGKGFQFDEDGNPIIDPETGKQKFEGFNALEVYEGGRVSIAKKPKLPTEVARLEEINELDTKLNTKIDTLHANGFIVAQTLPTASKDTVGKIYLIPQEEGGEKDIYDEYITVSSNGTCTWEKIGSTVFKQIVDTELSLDSTNPVQNKVITETLESKLDKITTTGASRMYTITGAGKQGTVNYGPTPVASWIPIYEPSGNGALQVGPPTKPVHATPKKYVDDLVASVGGYVHNMAFYTQGIDEISEMPITIVQKLTGTSKISTAFTYVENKGICLGAFNYEEHPDIAEFGIQPKIFVPTSAHTNNLQELYLLPKVEILEEFDSNFSGKTLYLTKLNDIDLTNINDFTDYVTEA